MMDGEKTQLRDPFPRHLRTTCAMKLLELPRERVGANQYEVMTEPREDHHAVFGVTCSYVPRWLVYTALFDMSREQVTEKMSSCSS